MLNQDDQIIQIPIKEILADEDWNCRGHIDLPKLQSLIKDIQINGLIQPITVRPLEHPKYKYKVITGHRRLKAHEILKVEKIKAIIHNVDDHKARILNLQENIQREDLNILQEAKAIETFKILGMTPKDVAEELSVSPTWVQIRYLVLELPYDIQMEAAAGFLTQEQIRAVHAQPSKEKRYSLVKRIKEAKQRQEKIILPSEVDRKPYQRKERNKTEIEEMIMTISNVLGFNFATVCLGWAAGNNSNLEIFEELALEAKKQGINYSIPKTLYMGKD